MTRTLLKLNNNFVPTVWGHIIKSSGPAILAIILLHNADL